MSDFFAAPDDETCPPVAQASIQWVALNGLALENESLLLESTPVEESIDTQWAYCPGREDFKPSGRGHHPLGYHAHYAKTHGIDEQELAMIRQLTETLQSETKDLMSRVSQWLRSFDPTLKLDGF